MLVREKDAYEKSLELFDGVCAMCGNPNVALHHIKYGRLYGTRKSLTYYGNLIPLCEYHHRLVHTNKDKYMPMLQEMVKKKMEV